MNRSLEEVRDAAVRVVPFEWRLRDLEMKQGARRTHATLTHRFYGTRRRNRGESRTRCTTRTPDAS